MGNKLLDLIKEDEGTGPVNNDRMMPYTDSVGLLTVGYGRNIEERGISFDEADVLLQNDVNISIAECNRTFTWFDSMDEIRKMVVISMAYNMGISRFLGFKKTIALLSEGKYTQAGTEMLDSKWATQVGRRAVRLSRMMKTGVYGK